MISIFVSKFQKDGVYICRSVLYRRSTVRRSPWWFISQRGFINLVKVMHQRSGPAQKRQADRPNSGLAKRGFTDERAGKVLLWTGRVPTSF